MGMTRTFLALGQFLTAQKLFKFGVEIMIVEALGGSRRARLSGWRSGEQIELFGKLRRTDPRVESKAWVIS
jgi:hypothetical protein